MDVQQFVLRKRSLQTAKNVWGFIMFVTVLGRLKILTFDENSFYSRKTRQVHLYKYNAAL